MDTADTDTERTEWDRVTDWRERTLIDAGYPADDATLLAIRPDIDLHAACELVINGCDVLLAVEILR